MPCALLNAREPEEESILVDVRTDYAIVRMNRPEKRNAMNRAAQAQFRDALKELRNMKAIVLTGSGNSFCAGVDIKEAPPEVSTRTTSQGLDGWLACQEAIRRHAAIFIAAVNGFALGGGSTLINTCELAIAAESAWIGTPEISFGIWPRVAGPAMIKRILPKHAAELIFNAKRIDAATAYRMGLVNEVVADSELMPRACSIAEGIAGFEADVLDWGKKAYHRILEVEWDDAMDYSNYTSAVIKSQHRGANRDGKNLNQA